MALNWEMHEADPRQDDERKVNMVKRVLSRLVRTLVPRSRQEPWLAEQQEGVHSVALGLLAC